VNTDSSKAVPTRAATAPHSASERPVTQDTQLPVDVLHWALALAPLIVLLVLLVALRWKAPEAGPVGLLVAAVIAMVAFETPWDTIAVAGAKGVWDGIFILYVIWPALLLYRIADRAGAFVALREGIERFSNNELFLVLAFGWVFASFLQGITGFGAPIAIVAPLLIALGVKPVYAVVIPLIGHAWANLFGTLAVAWLATTSVIDLQQETQTAFQTAILLWIPNLLAGVGIAWLFGRGGAVVHAMPMVLIISVIHGGGQLLLSLWNPVLAAFLPATAALLVLYPLSNWKRYSEPMESGGTRHAMTEEDPDAAAQQRKQYEEEEEPEPVMGLAMALMPYAVLAVLTVAVLVITPIESALEQFEVGFPFPEVQTGLGVQEEAEQPYSPFAPLTHPGTFLLAASLIAWVVYRSRNYYSQWAERTGEREGIISGVLGDAIPASLAVLVFLAMSTIMDHSGQTTVLALGIAEVAPAMAFAGAANAIGMLGSFMTSSNTASNILFSPLQQTVAAAEGLPEAAIIAAQGAGGAIGNSISPANVVLGTGTAGIVGQEGAVLRKTIPWALLAAAATGAATLLLL
jgi:lactate permease